MSNGQTASIGRFTKGMILYHPLTLTLQAELLVNDLNHFYSELRITDYILIGFEILAKRQI